MSSDSSESDIIARVEAAGNKITKNYYDGTFYYGQMEGSKRHGYGTYTYANGQKYVGEWKNGNKHGQGTQTKPDGTIYYSGEWVNNKPYYYTVGTEGATVRQGCGLDTQKITVLGHGTRLLEVGDPDYRRMHIQTRDTKGWVTKKFTDPSMRAADSGAYVRKDHNISSDLLFELRPNEKFTTLCVRMQVKTENGEVQGWVSEKYLIKPSSDETKN